MIDSERKLKLELVRLEGICKLLINKCALESLEMRVISLTDTEIKDVKKTIYKLSRRNLILLVEQSPEITNEDVDQVYELNRYGLKPGFTLYYLSGQIKEIEIEKIKDIVDNQLKSIEYLGDEQYKNVVCKSVEKILNDTMEITFSYMCKYTYVSDEEKPEFIYELKETFVWINTKDSYIAIKTVPNKVMTIIKGIFSRVFETRISVIRLTKKMIEEIFGDNNMKKGTFYKPNANDSEPQKVTIADSNLSEKPLVRGAYSEYDLTSSSLQEEVSDDITSTLGINCKQGKIYLTKNLNASDFRAWSVKRIKDIIGYMGGANLEEFEEFEVRNIMEDLTWNGFTNPQKKLLEKIIFSIYCAKKHGLESFDLSCTTNEIWSKLNKFFYTNYSFECDECDEVCVGHCDNCGSPNLVLDKKGGLTCCECGTHQEGFFNLQCESGHGNSFSGIERFIVLVPNSEILNKINDSLRMNFEMDNEKNDIFYIHDGQISILQPKTSGEVIETKNIPEFECVLNEVVDIGERNLLINEYKKIKEKCSKHCNEECNKCAYTNNECIMKLFTVFGFRPSPHQNSEFGDVNLSVTYHKSKKRLVGIAKSKTTNQETLTMSTNPAREMIQQVLTMTHDSRAEIIAVICPMRFHPQLEAELEYIAKITDNKLMYFEDEFMVRLLKYYRKLEAMKKSDEQSVNM